MDAHLRLLVIEDNQADFLLLQRHLQRQGLEASCARIDSMAELESALAAQRWDAVQADYNVQFAGNGVRTVAGLDLQLPERPAGHPGGKTAPQICQASAGYFPIRRKLSG